MNIDKILNNLFKDINFTIIEVSTGEEITLEELKEKIKEPCECENCSDEELDIIDMAGKIKVRLQNLPKTRETSIAITKLDECVFWYMYNNTKNNDNKKSN